MVKGEFKKESDFVRFDGVCLENRFPTAVFRIAEQYGYAGGQCIVDQDGNLQRFYHVKARDLQKRRRKLIRQGIEPSETDKAISSMMRNDVCEAFTERRPSKRPAP